MNLNDILKVALSNPNAEAWLRVIRSGETTQDPRAYYMVNGGSFIDDLTRHPWDGIPTTDGAKATGAYQFLGTTWAHCRMALDLADFGQNSQDLAALYLTQKRGALDDVLAGRIPSAMAKCAKEWVSLPPNNWAATYAKYGGLLNDSQPAAPIEEHSETLPQPEQSTMPSIALSFLQPLLSGVLNLFSGRAQAAIGKATGADPESAEKFFNNLIGMVGAKVGVPVTNQTSAIEAVGKLTAMQDAQAKAAAVAEIESHALDYLDKIAPLLDKLAEQDKARAEAQVKAGDAAAIRGKGDRVELAPVLVKQSDRAFLVALILTGVGLSIQMWFSASHTPDGMLMGLFTILIYCVARTFEAPYRYRFGGTVDSTATEATTDTIKTANQIKGK